jgi:hypothetical protein
MCLNNDLEAVVIEWLEYGKFRGLGQWRNSGKGRVIHEIIKSGYETPEWFLK